jgi:hypothetical protein
MNTIRIRCLWIFALCTAGGGCVTIAAEASNQSQTFELHGDSIAPAGVSRSGQFSLRGGQGPIGAGAASSESFLLWSGAGVQEGTASGVQIPLPDRPRKFRASQNRPNPFSGWTVLRYQIPSSSLVTVRILDPSGRLIRQLDSGVKGPGRHALRWDGRDGEGRQMPTGIYFYELRAGSESYTGRMLMIK